MRFAFKTLADAVDATLAFSSPPIDLVTQERAAVHVYVTGTASGNITLYASNDEGPLSGNDTQTGAHAVTHWVQITGVGALVDAANPLLVDFSHLAFRWLQVRWAPAAGTGTLSIKASAKGQ